MKYTVAIVDDHELVAKAIAGLVGQFADYEVLFDAENGKELIKHFKLNHIPNVVLLDINMPDMDGYETSLWLKNNYPEVKVLALSMNDKEEAIVRMLRNGVRGYLLKGCRPSELREALDSVINKGFYYTEFVTSRLIKSLNPDFVLNPVEALGLSEREAEFIQLACTDMTYVEIADKMCVSPRTVDGYRESLFVKFNVKSRVGLAVEAIRLGVVQV
jgi:two-component system, NarL family, invasion response regulator UvrY